MEALIIAAGKGSRLNHYSRPKPLIHVLGYPLIEHIIQGAKKASITHFKIVLGYEAEQIQKTLGHGERLGVCIDYIHNPEWKKGNGRSVFSAKEHIKDDFVLLMGDHVFDSAILDRLLRFRTGKSLCVLAVDHKIKDNHINIDEATRVWVANQKVQKIAKGLIPYNGVDTGVFLYSSIVFDALKENIDRGKDLLTDANQSLAEREKLMSMDIDDHFWVDVDDGKTLKQAEKMLSQGKL
jgi:choline kinase